MAFSPFVSEVAAEFIGTFLFVLTIPLASLGVGSLAPLPIGFMLAAMTFSFGYISGAHFNPAVTFATLINGKIYIKKALLYILAQILAAFLAALYGSAIVGLNIPVPSTDVSLVSVWQAILCEMVYTFALASVVLHVNYSRQRGNEFYGFAIGMTVLSASFAVGGFTGGAFNPAVATGTQLVGCIGGNCKPLIFFWIYWVAPLGGSVLASIAYQILDTHDRASPNDILFRVF
ncbi:aquaporin 9 [Trypanosoma rangeli]|uniref:Aquaporin 9 n=1 Tax=Trypanosoma rangeli TaxID=5698 RepID=A0A422NSX8_TRYRA|nr:aquaporin 9 [Trypanosoma rangeli]RNF08577.1 aquaporin 9 [Trypanosoma rangeli]|eukprot:RNF08577.1 aquaporin 9 [Trypanosoma rangeli]